jgi:hypothetical protein
MSMWPPPGDVVLPPYEIPEASVIEHVDRDATIITSGQTEARLFPQRPPR